MFLPLFVTTFTTVFLAELGDKTQLATLAISGSTNKPLAAFIGSSSALVLASFLGVLAGGSIANLIPANILKMFAALGFLAIGSSLLWPLTKSTDDDTTGT